MLTKTQIQTVYSVAVLAKNEGAVLVVGFNYDVDLETLGNELVGASAELLSINFEFREESVHFGIDLYAEEIANAPIECIGRIMMVRRALVNMSSN
jgi:hypothetical protein